MKTAKFANKAPSSSSEVILTKRGERVVRASKWAAGILVGTVVAVSGTAIADINSKNYTYSETTKSVVANPGDGLLDIARTVSTNGEEADLRDISDEIKTMNDASLQDGLQAGEVIVVPDSVIVD